MALARFCFIAQSSGRSSGAGRSASSGVPQAAYAPNDRSIAPGSASRIEPMRSPRSNDTASNRSMSAARIRFATAVWPAEAAQDAGVRQCAASRSRGSAPWASSTATAASLPWNAAAWSGVDPSFRVTLTTDSPARRRESVRSSASMTRPGARRVAWARSRAHRRSFVIETRSGRSRTSRSTSSARSSAIAPGSVIRAPAPSSVRTDASAPSSAAWSNGVSPAWSSTFGSAPRARSAPTTSACAAAKWSAVRSPSKPARCPRSFTSRGSASRRAVTVAVSPR